MVKQHFALRIIGTLLLICLTSACTMIPEYQQPKAPIPTKWKIAMAKDQGKRVDQMTWQSFFIAPELKNLIKKSLENNRDLKAAALNIQVAREQYNIQRSYVLPTINASGNYTREKVYGGTFNTSGNFIVSQYTANIGMTAFEIDLFGRLRSLNAAALDQYFATAEAKNTTQIVLISSIANTYVKYLADKAQLELSIKTAEAQKKSRDIIARRVNVGVTNKLDLEQAETLLQKAEVDKSTLRRTIEQDRNALDLLVGTILKDSELTGSFDDAEGAIARINSGLPSDLLQNRPDIKQAEYMLKAANANIGAARASLFPTISLTASGGRASGELGKLFDGGSGIWAFSPQVTLPIFTAGRNWAGLRVTKAQKDLAIVQYEQTIQTAFREVSDLLIARETMDAELSSQIKLANAAQNYYQIAKARYEKGVDNYLATLDAIRSTYTADQDVINKRLARIGNMVSLYTALGGGYDLAWDPEQDNNPRYNLSSLLLP